MLICVCVIAGSILVVFAFLSILFFADKHENRIIDLEIHPRNGIILKIGKITDSKECIPNRIDPLDAKNKQTEYDSTRKTENTSLLNKKSRSRKVLHLFRLNLNKFKKSNPE